MAVEMLNAVFIIVVGLYLLTFRDAVVKRAIIIAGEVTQSDMYKRIYNFGFTILGVSFIILGVLVIFLII